MDDSPHLVTFESRSAIPSEALVRNELSNDNVVRISNIEFDKAEKLVGRVCTSFGLFEKLTTESAFASVQGHRKNIGSFFMTVNDRFDYQIISPHSEGDSYSQMQIAAFYCFKNTTDGGETILFNVNDLSEDWSRVRERVTRLAPGSRRITSAEAARMGALYRLRSADDFLRPDDIVLQERPCDTPGVKLVQVLAIPEKVTSIVLSSATRTYWDTIRGFDRDLSIQFAELLRDAGLLREPTPRVPWTELTGDAKRHIYSSGATLKSLFKRQIAQRLVENDLVIFNNFTWAHSVANWTPHSGIRKVAAAFA